jgi:cellulose synthase/poly-beta-1,6-N-acetylglucosamine synthase-like glycosyltransferase
LILDADTRLSPDALSAALAEQARTNADAVAFWIEVEHTHGLLALLQHQEYLAAFNLQRAGLTAMGIMAILPGPATLFRRSVLEANPLLSRTCTEDADLTLTLSRSGHHLTMAASARARTVVPRSWRALIGQRTRWLTGHLQCIRFHLPTIGAGSVRHRLLIFPNFLVSTLALSLGLLVILAFVTSARSPLLDLDLPMVMMITSGLLYLQRVSSWLIFGDRNHSFFMVFLEPLVSGLVASITFPLAVKRLALDQRIHPWKGTWAPPR